MALAFRAVKARQQRDAGHGIMLLQIGDPIAAGHDPATELMPQGNRVEMRALGEDAGDI
ncbi:hypothetical protein D3C75_1278720 [compost metagenome]